MSRHSSRIAGLVLLAAAASLTQWAFRFHLEETPVDSFVRVLVCAADVLIVIPALVLFFSGKKLSGTVKSLLTRFPTAVSLYLSCAAVYLTLVAVEFSCRYYFRNHYAPPHIEVTEWDPSPNPRHAKGDTIRHRYLVNDTLIYDLKYAIDTLGRRTVPLMHDEGDYSHFALLQVCSYPFGYGLTDGQTFARVLDSICGLRPYNYSISGQGPQHIPAMLHSTELTDEICEGNGRLVYLFIDDHIQRLIGSRRLIKMWAARFPYFYLEKGELKWDRTFVDGRPFTTYMYMVLSKSAFIDLFNIEIPRWTFDRHLRLAAKTLALGRDKFLWHYPEGEFLVVIGPGSRLAPRLKRFFEEEGVSFVDLSELLDKEQPEYKIHRTDGHPNGLYYQRIAEELKRYFEENPLP